MTLFFRNRCGYIIQKGKNIKAYTSIHFHWIFFFLFLYSYIHSFIHSLFIYLSSIGSSKSTELNCFMDLRSLLLLIIIALKIFCIVNGNLVFPVERRKSSLSGIVAHDSHRRGRFLSAVDFNLGGNGLPTKNGFVRSLISLNLIMSYELWMNIQWSSPYFIWSRLYFTKIELGSPKKNYYVQVDTGSDITWVNCIECKRCPKKSDIGVCIIYIFLHLHFTALIWGHLIMIMIMIVIWSQSYLDLIEFPIFSFSLLLLQQMDLTLYDYKASKTSEVILCDHEFCSSTYEGPIPGCKAQTPCPYSIAYGDGGTTFGYYVKDYLTLNRVNGNLHTVLQNSSIFFGWE